MQAKIDGMNQYNANEGKNQVLEQELALIEDVREDASVNSAYWDAGYALGQEFSKGLAAGKGATAKELIVSGLMSGGSGRGRSCALWRGTR